MPHPLQLSAALLAALLAAGCIGSTAQEVKEGPVLSGSEEVQPVKGIETTEASEAETHQQTKPGEARWNGTILAYAKGTGLADPDDPHEIEISGREGAVALVTILLEEGKGGVMQGDSLKVVAMRSGAPSDVAWALEGDLPLKAMRELPVGAWWIHVTSGDNVAVAKSYSVSLSW